jgi:hypothetical protein
MYDARSGFSACDDNQSCQQCRIQHTVQDASTAVIRNKTRWSNVRDCSTPHHGISAQSRAIRITTSHTREDVVHEADGQDPSMPTAAALPCSSLPDSHADMTPHVWWQSIATETSSFPTFHVVQWLKCEVRATVLVRFRVRSCAAARCLSYARREDDLPTKLPPFGCIWT